MPVLVPPRLLGLHNGLPAVLEAVQQFVGLPGTPPNQAAGTTNGIRVGLSSKHVIEPLKLFLVEIRLLPGPGLGPPRKGALNLGVSIAAEHGSNRLVGGRPVLLGRRRQLVCTG